MVALLCWADWTVPVAAVPDVTVEVVADATPPTDATLLTVPLLRSA